MKLSPGGVAGRSKPLPRDRYKKTGAVSGCGLEQAYSLTKLTAFSYDRIGRMYQQQPAEVSKVRKYETVHQP